MQSLTEFDALPEIVTLGFGQSIHHVNGSLRHGEAVGGG